ncbi:MAG TPA: Panacea domain-containing protein [Spirochaetota bacterium]|nr:MAG: hypothetical protein BWY96_01651 [Spirochaetes bacterium ADurb.BinA120]HNU92653.1 Panacea domain-containing protein [Spirochaetota bacterium]HPV98990.1 Panacea domain-containing protein [Spirochaetota bacterium]
MDSDALVPWNRYALITELARRLEHKSPKFGKTALQKMVYFLTELFDIHTGYEFEFYNYGPFSSQLHHDLDLVAYIGGVAVEEYSTEFTGYAISPGKRADALIKKGAEFIQSKEVDDAITRVINEFGGYNASELELRATILFVDRDLAARGKTATKDTIVDIVGKLKPRFTRSDIITAQESMASFAI